MAIKQTNTEKIKAAQKELRKCEKELGNWEEKLSHIEWCIYITASQAHSLKDKIKKLKNKDITVNNK